MKKKNWIWIFMGVVALLAAALTIIMVARRTNDQKEDGRPQIGQEQTTEKDEERTEQTTEDSEKNTEPALSDQPEGAENHGNKNDSEGATEFLPEQGTEQPGDLEQGKDKLQESKNPSPIELPFLPYEG